MCMGRRPRRGAVKDGPEGAAESRVRILAAAPCLPRPAVCILYSGPTPQAIMSRDKRSKQQIRASVAAAAARMIAEDGLNDFALAKRKAARQLGVEALHVLPDNEELEAALRMHQNLYQEEEQGERLQQMREEALEVMEYLAPFRPYLRGGVLKGTATRYGGIELQIFAEDSKTLEIFLLNRNIPFELRSSRRDPSIPVFSLDWQGTPVSLTVQPLNDERLGSGAGKAAERVSAQGLRDLMSTTARPPESGELS